MSDVFKEIVYLQGFEKDMRRLSKRFRTLNDDLMSFIKTQLQATHKLKLDNKGVFRIQDIGFDHPKIYKAKKFACQSLFGKGARSGIRVI